MTWPQWDEQLLSALGVAPTPPRRAFLAAWAACEGGHASFNPLNTTFNLTGATLYNPQGVKDYRDRLQGLAATLLTLRLSYYADLRAALAAPNLTAKQILERSSRSVRSWGTSTECIGQRLS